jgi:hypothetical protein
VTMPVVRNPDRGFAGVAELQAPDPIDLDRCHGELGLDASALQILEQRHAIEHQGSRQVDRVDAAPLAGTVHSGRARGERVGHRDMRAEGRPRDLEIQVVRAEGRGGPPRSALQVRDDGGTGPLTHGSGRMGSKDPVGISACMSLLRLAASERATP